ncbi:hypothetical protein Mapa_017766 [Marchantia paleacea]|nr:hypothetical protein Mapa_017766 [Marchantia paleacea]
MSISMSPNCRQAETMSSGQMGPFEHCRHQPAAPPRGRLPTCKSIRWSETCELNRVLQVVVDSIIERATIIYFMALMLGSSCVDKFSGVERSVLQLEVSEFSEFDYMGEATVVKGEYAVMDQACAGMGELVIEDPPLIDLSGLDGPERARIGNEIDEACKKWGFFQIINHGFDSSLMRKAKMLAKEFFKQPEEQKMKFRVTEEVFEGYCCSKLRDSVGKSSSQNPLSLF